MTTALYRKSSNEVLKISIKGQSFDDRNTTVYGVLTDPTLLDGNQVRETTLDATGAKILGPMKQLGFAKIAITGTNTIRNATQIEIDTFSTLEIDDDNQLDADQAINLFETHPQFRKMMVAFASTIMDEINILRAREGLAARTLSQLKTAIRNRVNKND